MPIIYTTKFICAECKTELEGFEYQDTGIIEFKECLECASIRDTSWEESLNSSFEDGKDEGYSDGQVDGYDEGYNEGYDEGTSG